MASPIPEEAPVTNAEVNGNDDDEGLTIHRAYVRPTTPSP
jgi:hypothetical protein